MKQNSIIGIKLQQILQDLRGAAYETNLKAGHDSSVSRSEIFSNSVDVESNSSSPDEVRKFPAEETVTFESFKKALDEPVESKEEKKVRFL